MSLKYYTAAVLLGLMLLVSPASGQSITSFSPTSGKPGVQVTINGSGFFAAGITNVLFDTVLADFSFVSSSQLIAIVPAGAITGKIKLNGASGPQSSANFTVAPRIDSFTPPLGAAGTPVTLEGANYVSGATTVKFGTNTASVSVTSSSQLQATVPAGATNGFITVTTAAGSVTTTDEFVVSSAPVITSFDPAVGTNGTLVQIEGANFINGGTTVKFNNVTASGVTVLASTQLRATVAGGTTTGKITVTTANGTATSTGNFVTDTKPIITGFDPAFGGAGTSVNISGFNFSGVTAVKFNNLFASVTAFGPTNIQAVVPSGATNGPISVTTGVGTGTSSSNFLSGSGPIISGFSPVIGAPGTQVTINGVNFSQATVTVRFNNTIAFTGSASADTQILVTVPAGATTGKITVTRSGVTGTSVDSFTVTPAGPLITDFSPSAGPRGTAVTINGANFSGVTAVRFNGVASASFSATSTTQISALVPVGATSGLISVTASGVSYTNPATFYLPPRVTTLSSTSGVVGDVITITGTNFTGVSSVDFAGVAATVTSNSATVLKVAVPNTASGPITIVTPAGSIVPTNNFTVLPYVASFTPSLGPVGTVVTIAGSSFTNVSAVKFGGINSSFAVNSSTQIVATVLSGSSTGPITVTTPDGTGASSVPFTVTASTDLEITETNSPGIVLLGDTFYFLITVTNHGPSAATAVTAQEILGSGIIFVSATNSQGTFALSNNVVTFSFGVISNHASATGTVAVKASFGAQIENRVSVSAAEPDPNLSNSSTSHSFIVLSDDQRTLAIRKVDAVPNVEISWPLSPVNFILQFNTNLVSTNNIWTDSPDVPNRVTNQSVVSFVVTNDASSGRKFYRLKFP